MSDTAETTNTLTYKYRLIVFVNKKKQKKIEIEIIPSDWIFYDHLKNTIQCKYMCGPYDEEKKALLSMMIRNCEIPKSNWPSYEIEFRGRAKTYSEAQKLVSELEYKPYVYSTENEGSALKKANEDFEYFKNRTIPKHFATKILDNVFNDFQKDFHSNTELDNLLSEHASNSKGLLKTDKRTSKQNKAFIKSKQYPLKGTSSKYMTSRSSSSSDRSIDEVRRRKTTSSKNNSKPVEKGIKNRAHSISNSATANDNKKRRSKNFKNQNLKFMEMNSKRRRVSVSSASENDTGSDEIKNNKLQNDKKVCCVHEETLKSLEIKIDMMIANYHALAKQIGTQNSLIIEMKNSFSTKDLSQYDMVSDYEENSPNVKFPCKTRENFDELEVALKDVNYNSKMVQKFLRMMNFTSSINKNASVMIRYCLSRDLALQFNLLKPNEKRIYVFNNTNLYKVVKNVLIKSHSNNSNNDVLPDHKINVAIASVFYHARDWDGYRNIRKSKKMQQMEISVILHKRKNHCWLIRTHKFII